MKDLWIVLVIACGYVASIYTWPWVRLRLQGAQVEAAALRAKAKAIDVAFRGKL